MQTREGQIKKTKTPSGLEVNLYPSSFLLEVIGRDYPTITKWEISGILPYSHFSYINNIGIRCRLYTQEQINAVQGCMKKYKVFQGCRISPAFKEELKKRFSKLAIEYGTEE